ARLRGGSSSHCSLSTRWLIDAQVSKVSPNPARVTPTGPSHPSSASVERNQSWAARVATDGGRDPLAGRGSPNPRDGYVWSTDAHPGYVGTPPAELGERSLCGTGPLPGSAGTPPAELGERSLCSTDALPGFAETSGRLLRIGTRKSRIEL